MTRKNIYLVICTDKLKTKISESLLQQDMEFLMTSLIKIILGSKQTQCHSNTLTASSSLPMCRG